MASPRLLMLQEVALNPYIFKKHELELVCYKEKEVNVLRGGELGVWEKLQAGVGRIKIYCLLHHPGPLTPPFIYDSLLTAELFFTRGRTVVFLSPSS